MRRILAAAILVASTLTWGATMTRTRRSGVTAEHPGSSLKRIHIAEVEFDHRTPVMKASLVPSNPVSTMRIGS